MVTNFYEDSSRMDAPEMNNNAGNGFFGPADQSPVDDASVYSPFPDGVTLDVPSDDDIGALSEAVSSNDPTFVDSDGTIHIEGEAGSENMVRVDGKTFGAPSSAETEVEELSKAFVGDGEYRVDEFGRIRLNNDPAVNDNMPRVDNGLFGAPNSAEAELEQLSKAFVGDDEYNVDEFGRIRLSSDPGVTDNMPRVDGNVFGAPDSAEAELEQLSKAFVGDDEYNVDEFGRIRLSSDPGVTDNMPRVDGNVFGAHEDQWYVKNPRLFQAEVAAMRSRFPKAAYGFMESTGNMYWVVTLNVFKDSSITKPWIFQLFYDKDHPHNHGLWAGSIKVVPLRPSLAELEKIAERHGRYGVPHVIRGQAGFYLKRYLCTRWSKDIADGTELVASAVQATAWAVDWAAHFELSMRDDCVWNKWCNDDHFRSWQVSCKKKTCDKRICPYGKRR